jgi:hypothetical protein
MIEKMLMGRVMNFSLIIAAFKSGFKILKGAEVVNQTFLLAHLHFSPSGRKTD